MKILLTICTARTFEETHYQRWFNALIPVFERRGKMPEGLERLPELSALFGSLLNVRANRHTDLQREAFHRTTLDQNDIGIDVVIFDRTFNGHSPYAYDVSGALFKHEVLWKPENIESYEKPVSMGCYDKNEAIICALRGGSDILVMMDDCCLPSFGFFSGIVDVYNTVGKPFILLIGHRKIYLEHGGSRVTTSDACLVDRLTTVKPCHLEAQVGRVPFGIFVMDTKIAAHDLNGYNENLDGQRMGLDEEFLVRAKRYLEEKDGVFVIHPAVRVYEIEHDMPWEETSAKRQVNFRDSLVDGYRSPTRDLVHASEHRTKVFI